MPTPLTFEKATACSLNYRSSIHLKSKITNIKFYMSHSIEDLLKTESGDVWRYFSELSSIPRPSKHEEKVREYLRNIANANDWQCREDAVGNLVLSLPGVGSLMNSPILIIQGHMDMVCEKNSDVSHDFMHDPISLTTDGDWVMGEGTTLGADNGIALAMMLAVGTRPVKNRLPLELLFTIDEETGLTGAMQLAPGILKGKMLLNIDSEDEGVFTIGCAGGIDIYARFSLLPYEKTSPRSFTVCLSGFQGGHSGISIHENRGNAIISAAILLKRLDHIAPELSILNFTGGNKKNAIPRESSFEITGVNRDRIESEAEQLESELQPIEPNAAIRVTESHPSQGRTIPVSIIHFLTQIRNGVVSMDPNFPDLVQSSSSAGVLTTTENCAEILIHARSSCAAALGKIEENLRKVAAETDGTLTTGHRYPGWNPNPNSQILKRGKMKFREVFGNDPQVSSIHAGLESGIIGDKLGTDELLSIGPTIENAHSPTERVNIKSVARTFRFLQQFVSSG